MKSSNHSDVGSKDYRGGSSSTVGQEDMIPIFLRRLNDLKIRVGTRTRFLIELDDATGVQVGVLRNWKKIIKIMTNRRFTQNVYFYRCFWFFSQYLFELNWIRMGDHCLARQLFVPRPSLFLILPCGDYMVLLCVVRCVEIYKQTHYCRQATWRFGPSSVKIVHTLQRLNIALSWSKKIKVEFFDNKCIKRCF